MRDALLTVPEVCRVLKLGRTTVNGLIRTGELESVTVRRCRRVTPEAVTAFVARQQADTLSAAGVENADGTPFEILDMNRLAAELSRPPCTSCRQHLWPYLDAAPSGPTEDDTT